MFDHPPAFAVDVAGHRLTLAVSGHDRFETLLKLVGAAKHSLRLFFYIFADDEVGQRVCDALCAARQRGVSVMLLLDGFGTSNVEDKLFAPLVAAGATVARFHSRWGRSYLLRNHQKIVVADESLALVGGSNIESDYFSDSETGWHDLMLSVEGPMAAGLAAYLDDLCRWMDSRITAKTLRSFVRMLAHNSTPSGSLRWLLGGPFQRLSPFARAIKLDLEAGRKVDLVQAYFAPHWGMLRRINRVISRRKGSVRLITAARSDNGTTIAAARHCYHRLLGGGVDIYEYVPQPLHMKLIVIDDIVYIGSANFDMRSLFVNAEIMIRIDDAGFAERMRGFVTSQLGQCEHITIPVHQRRASWIRRIRWLMAYFLVSTVDFTVTRRINFRRV